MNEKTKNILSLAAKIAVVAVILTVVILNYDALTNIDVRAIVENASSVYVAIAIIIGIYFAKSLLFVIPASLIYISIGMALPAPTAILVSFAGIAVEVTATYLLGVFLGGDAVKKLLGKSIAGQLLLEKEIQSKFSFVFLMRFSSLPIDFSSLFLGASGCKFPVYLLGSLAGIMPRVIALTILGDRIYDLIPMSLIIKIVLCILPLAVVFFVVKYFVDKKKKTAESADAESPKAEEETGTDDTAVSEIPAYTENIAEQTENPDYKEI